MKFDALGHFFILIAITAMLFNSVSAEEPITPIPKNADYDKPKAAIGKRLFFDPILSKDRTTSCASCHDLKYGGADSRPVSLGAYGQKGNIQSPTVLNARYNFKQFWNGRASNLFEQASGPMHNPKELNMDSAETEKRINASTLYKKMFENVYRTDTVTFNQILDAIVEFEKALITPDSRFDQFLRKEISLDPLEIKGYMAFKDLGCITCHNGINIGGNSFQQMGTIIPYEFNKDYPDLYSRTKDEIYKNVFKVPTLRNIVLTAPYFHNASASTLEEAIKIMSYHNLGFVIPDEKIEAIIAFLHTLTGKRPAILEE